MYVITNREIRAKEKGLKVFGKQPGAGPNDIRLLEVGVGPKFNTKAIPDKKLTEPELTALETQHSKFDLKLDRSLDWYPSLQVACELFCRCLKEGKHLLVYVHGYNNDMKDILTTAKALEKLYNVIVLPFSWPANGGGVVSGTAAYLSDKDDARASATALHRVIGKINAYHSLLTESLQRRLRKQAAAKHSDNPEAANALFVRLIDKECKVTLNLMCHSMGNYVLKYASLPSNSNLRQLVFDNISMVAADVNNPGHESWIEKLPARNRVYVAINENDFALKWSRRKPGDEQKERLGHHLRNLSALNVYYLDFTNNKGVNKEHAYFLGGSVSNNPTSRKVFAGMFEGRRPESNLQYHVDINVYRS